MIRVNDNRYFVNVYKATGTYRAAGICRFIFGIHLFTEILVTYCEPGLISVTVDRQMVDIYS